MVWCSLNLVGDCFAFFQEKTPYPQVDLESSDLVVLDEVYSDESEDENVSLDLILLSIIQCS